LDANRQALRLARRNRPGDKRRQPVARAAANGTLDCPPGASTPGHRLTTRGSILAIKPRAEALQSPGIKWKSLSQCGTRFALNQIVTHSFSRSVFMSRSTIFSVVGLLAFVASPLGAAPQPADVKATVEKSIAFLKTKQNADGSFAPKFGGPGITALIAAGLGRRGRAAEPQGQKERMRLDKENRVDGGRHTNEQPNNTNRRALRTCSKR